MYVCIYVCVYVYTYMYSIYILIYVYICMSFSLFLYTEPNIYCYVARLWCSNVPGGQRHTEQQLKRSHEIASRESDKSVCQSVRLFFRLSFSSFPILPFLYLSLSRSHDILCHFTYSFYRSQSFISFLTTDVYTTVFLYLPFFLTLSI